MLSINCDVLQPQEMQLKKKRKIIFCRCVETFPAVANLHRFIHAFLICLGHSGQMKLKEINTIVSLHEVNFE